MAYHIVPHHVPERSRRCATRNLHAHKPSGPNNRSHGPELTNIALNDRYHSDQRPVYQHIQPQLEDERTQNKRNHLVHYFEQPQVDEDKSDTSKDSAMKRGARGFARHVIAWAPEAAWCVVAALLLVGLVILLHQYNNQPLPQWPLGLTLNTAVALITTVLRSVTVVVVSEAISQLKWNRFAIQERRVADLHVFDQASRGPWGSLLMVVRGRGGILGMTAALVFVTGLATSTITQSTISYSTRLVASLETHASAMARTTYGEDGGVGPNQTSTNSVSPNSIENIAFQALYQPTNSPWPLTEPSCSSGDCRWKTFSSLAICYDLQNVTDNVRQTSLKYGTTGAMMVHQNMSLTLPVQGNFTLADDWSVIDSARQYNILSLHSPWSNDQDGSIFSQVSQPSFPPVRESLAHANDSDVLRATASQWLAIYTVNAETGVSNHTYRAVELLWHFCVKTYNISMEGGKMKREVLATGTKVRDGQGYGFDIPLDWDRPLRNYTILSEDEESKFTIFNTWEYQRLDRNMRDAFQGSYSTLWRGRTFNEFCRGFSQKMFVDVGVNMTMEEADQKVWRNLEYLAGTISDAITDFMQSQGASEKGEVLVSETFVQVRWTWLTFVAVQVGLSVLFLIGIACHTANLGIDVVKSSNLSELFALRHNTAYAQLPPEASGIRPSIDPSLLARLAKSGETWMLEVSPQQAGAVPRSTTSLCR